MCRCWEILYFLGFRKNQTEANYKNRLANKNTILMSRYLNNMLNGSMLSVKFTVGTILKYNQYIIIIKHDTYNLRNHFIEWSFLIQTDFD